MTAAIAERAADTHAPVAWRYRHGCRCEGCTAAATASHAEQRARRALRPAGEVPHGYSGYVNWLCRCAVCTEAKRYTNAIQAAARRRARGLEPTEWQRQYLAVRDDSH